jgi:ABC-type glycerol-3-phosphate transport system substrate-binding protein
MRRLSQALVLVALLGAAGCGGGSLVTPSGSTTAGADGGKTHDVHYIVGSSAPGSTVQIAYDDETGTGQDETTSDFPWNKLFKVSADDVTQVRLTASANSVDLPDGLPVTPTVSCQINVDGHTASSHQGSGTVICSAELE